MKRFTAEQFEAAFRKLEPLPKHQLKMLRANFLAPGHAITATSMAKEMGWDRYSAANVAYGKLALRVFDSLGVEPPEERVRLGILVTFPDSPGDIVWKLRPEVVEALKRLTWFPLEPSPQTKPTFLLVWNPKEWAWDSFEADYKTFLATASFSMPWGVGNAKFIRPGDRVLFLKVGKKEPRGIMGSGFATSSVFRDESWRKNGKEKNFVDVKFDVLLNPASDAAKMISQEMLKSDERFSGQDWRGRASGVSVKPEVAENLEAIWIGRFDYINRKSYVLSGGRDETYFEGAAYERVAKKYERHPQAKARCLEIHGYKCSVCEFDFEERYGSLGKGYIHVHHLVPLHARKGEYQVDPAKDLVPICPNCHAMVHKASPPIPVEKLAAMLDRRDRN